MKLKYIRPCDISQIFIDNIKNPEKYFVFSTDVALNSWIEWIVKNSAVSGVKAVARERFIAWDHFKEEFAGARKEGKQAIPSVLRKVFVHDLISKNQSRVENGEEPLFKSIINPKYASQSYSFVDWIAKNIPSLKMWHEKLVDLQNHSGYVCDDEDKDYAMLYKSYSEFLGDTMFEPSWETPSLIEDGKEFILIFPEQLEDFDEYKKVFADCDNITSYLMDDKNIDRPSVIGYRDARGELRHTVLKIRDLVEKSLGKIRYEDIALTVPDIESTKPYIKRELEKYCVPYVIRTGDKIIYNTAASIFEDFKNCVTKNFDYDSVRSLLLNDYIPWKDKDLNLNLVKEGQRLHIVCSKTSDPEDDEWIRTLNGTGTNELELRFYKKLKGSIKSMYDADSFNDIKVSWFTFKTDFLVDDEFTQSANNILGQCINELESLIGIEEDFIRKRNLKIENPYDFYLGILKAKSYRPQEIISGVNVFDYRLCASASYRYNFIINANQKSLSVPYRPLSFINNKKRAQLGVKDSDSASVAFIRLYDKFNGHEGISVFSYSEESFSGFSIPHNFFDVADSVDESQLDCDDFILAEKEFFLERRDCISKVSSRQKGEFLSWKNKAYEVDDGSYKLSSGVENKINEVMVVNRSKSNPQNKTFHLTQDDMKKFFPCQRKWLLSTVLKLNEDDLESALLTNIDQGNINHKTLELLFDELGTLPVTQSDDSFGERDQEIRKLIRKCVYRAIHDSSMDFAQSPLILEILDAHACNFESIIYGFMIRFCQLDDNGEYYGGYEVYSTEKWYEAYREDIAASYSGKIDCLLKDDSGNVYIVDYKNKGVPSISSCIYNEKTEELEDYQCAMYVSLFNINNPENVTEHMLFQSIMNPGDRHFIIGKKKTLDEYKQTLAVFDDKAKVFVDMVSSGKLKPSSDSDIKYNRLDVYSNCRSCDFRQICRTSFTVAPHNI